MRRWVSAAEWVVVLVVLLISVVIGVSPLARAATRQAAPAAKGPARVAVGLRMASGAVSFNGDSGAVHKFSLDAGSYFIDVRAQYDSVNDPTGTGRCAFAGNLADLANGQIDQFDPGTVFDNVPYERTAAGAMGAGAYRLYISSTTTCEWRFSIVPAGSQNPTLTIVGAGVYFLRSGKFVSTNVVPMGHTVYFIVSYSVNGTLPGTLSGELTVQESSGPLQKGSLKGFTDEPRAYLKAVFSAKAHDVTGPAVATFILTSGTLRVSRTAHFTLSGV